MPNIHQLFQSMPCFLFVLILGFWFLAWSFLFVFFFSEWFNSVSHTMVCMQERGHMHIDDIVQHADKFQVTLCSERWKAPAFLTRSVCMQMGYLCPAQKCPAQSCPAQKYPAQNGPACTISQETALCCYYMCIAVIVIVCPA